MENFDLTNLKIMIVDDYAPMRRLLFSILRELGINSLTQANNGQHALEELNKAEPDLIITDALMEPMDGLEFTRQIRQGHGDVDPFLPIIMVSGQTELSFILTARDAGVTEFLAKPISATSVYARISGIIAKPRPFIRTGGFFGPDRRRHASAHGGSERRSDEHEYNAGEAH